MTRQEKILLYLSHINENNEFIKENCERLEVYEGCLEPKIQDILARTLSSSYYDKIQSRVLPINVLTRIMDKLAKVYAKPPIRTDKVNQEVVEIWEQEAAVNVHLSYADIYSHLFKGYALEPFIKDGKRKMRAIPYDRFLPLSLDIEDPLAVTDFIKFMGEKQKAYVFGKESQTKTVSVYFGYTANEFYAFDSEGDELNEYYATNQGLNPLGVIPFVYGRRSYTSLIPTPDSDILQLTKMIPVLLTDLSGAIMFQCFTIIYAVNVTDGQDLKLSPNAMWFFQSDRNSDQTPEIGTIKPEADIDKVLTFIKNTFSLWLETKGVRVGAIGQMDASSATSGISKIIDEMDIYDVMKKQIECFKHEENDLWKIIGVIETYYTQNGMLDGKIIDGELSPVVEFDEPRPAMTRNEEVDLVIKERNAGFLDDESAIKRLYPDLGQDEVDQRLLATRRVVVGSDSEKLGEGEDSGAEGLPARGEGGDSAGDN